MSLYVSAWGASIAVVLILVFVASHEAVVARQTPGTVMGRKPLMGWNTWCTQNSCGTDWCTSAEVLDVAQTIKDEGTCRKVRSSAVSRLKLSVARFCFTNGRFPRVWI